MNNNKVQKSSNKFHCEKCGICRVGKKEDYIHCDICNGCISKSISETHSCRKNIFDANEIKKWNQEIINITDSGVRSWEITTDMLKISVSLSQVLSGEALIQWAKMINKLIILSPVLASSYISNSNNFLNITKGRHIDSMAFLTEKIYDGSWKSGNFASKVNLCGFP